MPKSSAQVTTTSNKASCKPPFHDGLRKSVASLSRNALKRISQSSKPKSEEGIITLRQLQERPKAMQQLLASLILSNLNTNDPDAGIPKLRAMLPFLATYKDADELGPALYPDVMAKSWQDWNTTGHIKPNALPPSNTVINEAQHLYRLNVICTSNEGCKTVGRAPPDNSEKIQHMLD